jgi:hypothetical protein
MNKLKAKLRRKKEALQEELEELTTYHDDLVKLENLTEHDTHHSPMGLEDSVYDTEKSISLTKSKLEFIEELIESVENGND